MLNNYFTKILVVMILFVSPCYAEKYYCPSESGNRINDIYDTNASCEQWNSDFFKQHSPNLYGDCLNRMSVLKTKYDNGQCKQMIQKTHTQGQARCIVEMIPDSKEYIGIECYNDKVDLMSQVEKMYKK